LIIRHLAFCNNGSLDSAEIAMEQAMSWTAVAERSGDTAFARTALSPSKGARGPHESGVALHFPPQSKTSPAFRRSLRMMVTLTMLEAVCKPKDA
jgi:hypothetical protein